MNDRIAYQNKDIISKTFMEEFRGKSLEVYGVHLPRIVRLLPTNLPAFEANELRIDNLLELEDGTLAIIDYESEYNEEDKLKYLGYMMRVCKRQFKEGKGNADIRMVVIYTADVQPKSVKRIMQRSGFSVKIEPAFLSGLKVDAIYAKLSSKISKGETLTDEEAMELIILPLAYPKKERKKAIQEALELSQHIKDRKQANFIIAGIVVFTDKIIDGEMKEKARRLIEMTQIAMMFEQEKEEAVKEAVKETKDEAVKERSLALVQYIENAAQGFGVSIKEACEKMKITDEEYNSAKKLVEEATMGAA